MTSSAPKVSRTPRGEVRYLDVGEGAPVVLLNGAAGADLWDPYVPTLAQAFRVIVPEATTDPADRQAAVGDLLDTLGLDSVALIGHASGGGVALAVARARTDVAALVLFDALAADAGELADGASTLAHRELPVLLVWGEDDATAPLAGAEALADQLPMSTLAVIPDSGHDMLRTDVVTVLPLLFEWLRYRYLRESHRHDQEGPVLVTLDRRPTMAEEGIDDLLDDPTPGDPG
ncbi:MAG: alpha/beta hydrolase [Actinomycetota bacterium]